MNKKLKVIIVDDHDMFRAGVKVLISKSDKIEVIAEAADGAQFLKLLDKLQPDVILMDISMPVMDGIEATRQALKINPELKILVLSMFGEEEYYYKMLQAGAKGFVLKSSGINQLEQAIIAIAKGSGFFSKELLKHVFTNIDSVKNKVDISQFNEQELSIIKKLTQNQSDEEIAQELNLDVTKIKDLHKDLLAKTGTNNTSALVLFAVKNKIVEI